MLKTFLADGFAVSVRTLMVIGVIMSSTSVLARIDSITQAAHEIIRQMWIFLFQFVECINISNQSIVATALGEQDYGYALQVVKRHLVYAIAIVSVMAVALMTQQSLLVGCFTSDATVMAMAATTIPLVAAAFPLDATSSILDGTLTAAGQATWTAKNTTVSSGMTLALLWGAERMMTLSLLWVWVFLKLMTVLRLPLLLHRCFRSESSPFQGAIQPALAAVDVAGLETSKSVPSLQPQVSANAAEGGS